MRVGLIGCSASKLDRSAPARELYTGELFKVSVAWLEHFHVPEWGILSAKHGLVMPEQVIEPYDVCLARLPAEERKAWAKRTGEQIGKRWGKYSTIFIVIAGAEYREALDRFPYAEDVIGHWGRMRRLRGKRQAMGIGILKQCLKQFRAFGC